MTDTLNTDVLAARAREVLVDLICADGPTLYRKGVQDAVERDMAAVSSRPSRVVAAMLRFAKEATPQSDGTAIPAGEVNPQEYMDFADAMHACLFHASGATRDDAKPYEIARRLGVAVKVLAKALASAPKVASDTMREAGLLREAVVRIERFVSLLLPQVPMTTRRNCEVEIVRMANDFADLRAALSVQSPANAGQDGEGVERIIRDLLDGVAGARDRARAALNPTKDAQS